MAKSKKKHAAEKKTVALPPGVPLIDTAQAAEAAARMVTAHLGDRTAAPARESSVFKQLKQSLAKPHAAGLDSLLNSTAPASSKRSGSPQDVMKQVGHNQTFGADVSRRNVPRRTAG
jgi:hypothetical protein